MKVGYEKYEGNKMESRGGGGVKVGDRGQEDGDGVGGWRLGDGGWRKRVRG